MVGKTGVALTDLKLAGEVRIQGEIWRAESASGDIQKDETVKVKALKGLIVVVEKSEDTKQQGT
jgi:membrane-bound ClpP family serine protease